MQNSEELDRLYANHQSDINYINTLLKIYTILMDSNKKYYEDYNFSGADKLYKLIKKDGYDLAKKILYHIYQKKKKYNNFKKSKKVILFHILQIPHGK